VHGLFRHRSANCMRATMHDNPVGVEARLRRRERDGLTSPWLTLQAGRQVDIKEDDRCSVQLRRERCVMRVLAISGRSSEVHERRGDRGHMAGPRDLLQTRRHFADYCGPLTLGVIGTACLQHCLFTLLASSRETVLSLNKHAADCDVERKRNESVP